MKMKNTRASTSSSTGCAEVPVLNTVTEFDAVSRTFAQMLCDRAEREPDVIAYCSWANGAACPTTWSEYLQQVREVTLGLHDLGAVPGDRVAIVSATRREWVVAALAIRTVARNAEYATPLGLEIGRITVFSGVAHDLRSALAFAPFA